jgi:hypothetical protein
LPFPSGNEFVDWFISVVAYNKVHRVAEELVNLPSIASELIQEFSECDHRKALYTNAALCDENFGLHAKYFGFLGITKAVGMTQLFESRDNFDWFDDGAFMQVR